jgi:hypothetical protein
VHYVSTANRDSRIRLLLLLHGSMGENMGSGVQNLGLRESVCGVFSVVTCEWRIIGIVDLFTGL